MNETVAHKTAAQTSAYCLLICLLKKHNHRENSFLHPRSRHTKEMGSTTVRLVAFAFVSTLMLLTHCAHAAAPAIFQQTQADKTWCVAKPSTGEAALRANLEFACSESDCSAIQGTGGCSAQNGGMLLSRASVAMNAYYQARGRNSWNCFFNATGIISITDPSLGTCKYA